MSIALAVILPMYITDMTKEKPNLLRVGTAEKEVINRFHSSDLLIYKPGGQNQESPLISALAYSLSPQARVIDDPGPNLSSKPPRGICQGSCHKKIQESSPTSYLIRNHPFIKTSACRPLGQGITLLILKHPLNCVLIIPKEHCFYHINVSRFS